MTATGSAADVAGINVDQVTAWLVSNVKGVAAPFTFTLIAGGRSNMTFEVTDAAGRKVVLRRPPMSHVLSSAHDMGREFRIISALQGTPVPVPDALGYCDDESVNERPFYIMDFVDGHILRTIPETEAAFDEAGRRKAADNLVDVLAAIHDVDVDAVGLGTLARRDGYIERQLKRWHGQFLQSQEQEKEVGAYRPAPLVPQAHDLLASRVPEQIGTAIVHGDYRLDNTILGGDGRVLAVLDWELCTLGDPLADLGTLLMYWAHGSSTGIAVTAMPGFPTREELAARYAATSGRDLSDLNYYLAFAAWKLACIMEGVYVRYAAGAMGAGKDEAEFLGSRVEESARRALDLLDGKPG
jgi:aminoglycoside phosphotransferase (APT) family kinase protein